MTTKIEWGRLPIVRKFGSHLVHFVYAAGGPEDGSLYGFKTLCGLKIEEFYEASEGGGVSSLGWIELNRREPHGSYCRRCMRVAL